MHIYKQPFVFRNCMHHSACVGGSKILYAWAKDAPPAKIPHDVGFKVGNDYAYMVLQVHYAHRLSVANHAGVQISFTERRYVIQNKSNNSCY